MSLDIDRIFEDGPVISKKPDAHIDIITRVSDVIGALEDLVWDLNVKTSKDKFLNSCQTEKIRKSITTLRNQLGL